MIKSISELLNSFILAEKKLLNSQNISHPVTIGSMYEGLTKKIVELSVFNDLELKVVTNSFIKGCKTEFDVMLVNGDGEKIPYTYRYSYLPENVIAIIQVKKNLYSKDLKDGYENLKPIYKYYNNATYSKREIIWYNNSFRTICKKNIPENRKDLSIEESYILDVLRSETKLPIRIVLGYNGFKSERNFRESFADYLETNISTIEKIVHGYGPQCFPNLIISDKYSLMKLNGIPYMNTINENKSWSFYASSSFNPTYFLLELIWSKLSINYDLPEGLFGDDLQIEPITRFIDGRLLVNGDIIGWDYEFINISDKILRKNSNIIQWKPVLLDLAQFTVINILCKEGQIPAISNHDLEDFVIKNNYSSLSDFIKTLTKTGLVFVDSDKLKLLTRKCQTAIVDGKFIAGENVNGLVTNWIKRKKMKGLNAHNKLVVVQVGQCFCPEPSGSGC